MRRSRGQTKIHFGRAHINTRTRAGGEYSHFSNNFKWFESLIVFKAAGFCSHVNFDNLPSSSITTLMFARLSLPYTTKGQGRSSGAPVLRVIGVFLLPAAWESPHNKNRKQLMKAALCSVKFTNLSENKGNNAWTSSCKLRMREQSTTSYRCLTATWLHLAYFIRQRSCYCSSHGRDTAPCCASWGRLYPQAAARQDKDDSDIPSACAGWLLRQTCCMRRLTYSAVRRCAALVTTTGDCARIRCNGLPVSGAHQHRSTCFQPRP